MAAATLVTSYLGHGLAAARPVSPAVPAGGLALWWSTDTTTLSAFDGATWHDVTGGGGGGGSSGLFGPVLSAIPTLVSTGFSASPTWVNQNSASAVNIATGLAISGAEVSGVQISGIIQDAPATPYSFTVLSANTFSGLISGGYNQGSVLGWYDGSNKLHLGVHNVDAALVTYHGLSVTRFSSPSAWSSNDKTMPAPSIITPVFRKIFDDGSNVHFLWSADGVTFYELYSVAKASGWLGATGYSKVVLGISRQASATTSNVVTGTTLSFVQGTS